MLVLSSRGELRSGRSNQRRYTPSLCNFNALDLRAVLGADVAESRLLSFKRAAIQPEILAAAAFPKDSARELSLRPLRYQHSAFFEQDAVLPPASAERFVNVALQRHGGSTRGDVQSACGVLP